jgi:hypothetical protein
MSTGLFAGTVTSPTMMFDVPCTLMQNAFDEALEFVEVHTAVWLPLNQLRKRSGEGEGGRGWRDKG